MQPIQVDIIGLKSLQRSIECAINIFATVASGVWVAWDATKGELGRDSNAVAVASAFKVLANDPLARASCVGVGCIDKVTSALKVAIYELKGSLLRDAPAPLCAKGHG